MKPVDINTLTPGQMTGCDYYNSTGELLLSKGVLLTERHLDILNRRNIFELFIKENREEAELRNLLSVDFKELDDLEIDLGAPIDPLALTALPELRQIKTGEEGLKQLLAGDKTVELDRELRVGHISDRPIGPALKERIRQMAVAERTDKYKEQVYSQYTESLRNIRTMLNRLADAQKVDGGEIRGVIERFIKIFASDRNILLNLSWLKPESDEYIYHHTLNVCLLSMNIAASYGYSEEQVIQISMGALLHDVGMLLVPRALRLKPGRLEGDEWFEIQKHPILGLHILEKVSHLPETIPYVAYQTHERDNGKGYPKQRSGRLIHAFAKIVQCADVFEAISSPRTYRPAYAPYQGMEIVVKMTRQGILMGEFVKAFLCYTSLFPVGSLVEMSDHRIGKVVATNNTSFTKPVIGIISDDRGKMLDPSEIHLIDLSREIDLQVIRCLPFESIREVGIMKGF
jgi:HD-GYP domain-containing protein (c-di-GMP phosphodiesterase class II)